jgi:hypothetical protein
LNGHITRRECLVALGIASALAVHASSGQWSRSLLPGMSGRDLREGPLGFLPWESAAEIGRAYLHAYPLDALEKATPLNDLLGSLVASFQGDDALVRSRTKRQLAAAIRADFRSGRIVVIDNWHLALTEARICALVALHA